MISLFTIFVKTLSWAVAQLPRWVQVAVGRALGLFWFYGVPLRRSQVVASLRLCFPDWDERRVWQTARANYQNYGCGFLEFLQLPYLDEKRFRKLFVIEGLEHYRKAANQGRGVFLLTLHLGSWELMSATSYHLKIPLNVITKKFKAQSLNQIWVNLRLDRGIKLIREEKSSFDILKAIRRGEAVGFILDQFMGPPVGVRTIFFGRETGTAASLALFADRTRAPVIPVYNVRGADGRIHVKFEEPVEFMEQGGTDKNISFMTQVYTSKIEEIIKRYPEQWLWLHRRWKPFRE